MHKEEIIGLLGIKQKKQSWDGSGMERDGVGVGVSSPEEYWVIKIENKFSM